MKMKKVLAVLLSASMLATMVACGSTAEPAAPAEEPAASEAPAAAAEEPAAPEAPAASADAASGDAGYGIVTSTLNLSNGSYEGDVFNAAGSGEGKAQSGLAVNISDGSLDGAISSTKSVHGLPYTAAAAEYLDKLAAEYGEGINPQGDGNYTVKYELLDEAGKVTTDAGAAKYIQVMEFTINEVYLIGQMINFPAANSTVEVAVAADGVWNVTSDSYITYLDNSGKVSVADGATLYIADGEALTGEVAAGTYGAKNTQVAEESSGMGMMMGGDASGDVELPYYEAPEKVVVNGTAVEANVKKSLGFIPTFTKREQYNDFTVGLDIVGNKVVAEKSILADMATENGDSVDITGDITAEGVGFTALAVERGDKDEASTVNLKDSTITVSDTSDGSYTNDFTGLGAVIVASGASEADHITLNIDNVKVTSTGFTRDGIEVDDYADAIITNSTFVVNGANPLPGQDAYANYRNSATQAYMLSPPWILGIQGGARTANVLGDYSSLTVVDSSMTAGAWAILSTDDCTSPTINVINSELNIKKADEEGGINGGAALFGYDYNYGSGYGTYNIGESNEYFYGATFNGVTMATIMTGTGDDYYGPSYDGLQVKNATGDVIYTYKGEGKDTVVNGVFGIMDHQGGSAQLDKGSVWNTEEAVILKKGTNDSVFDITGATLNPKSGIIFLMMDDDDGYGTGAYESTDETCTPGVTWGMPTFPGGWRELAPAAGI